MTCRILVVAPKFWPLIDDGSLRLMHWTSSLLRFGIQPTVVTPRWHPSWPSEAVCREIPVSRLLPPPKSAWSQSHFLRALGRWIALHRHQFDAIYVDDPFASLHLVSQPKILQGLPLYGRFHAASIASGIEIDPGATLASAADACRKLTRVVVPDAASDRRLRSIGIPEDRIVRIADLAFTQIRREPALRQLALNALGRVCGDLTFPQSHRLILSFSDINRRAGIDLLAKGIGKLLDEGANCTVWLIGEGNYKRAYYEMLRDRSWHRDIMLQGTFDSIEDLLQVADLCLFPGEGCSTQYFFPTVVAANLPWIAATSSDVKGVVGQEWSSLMFPPGDLQGLTTRLRSWLQDPSALELETAKAKSYFIEHQSAEGSLERWSSLFRGLL